MKTGKIQYATLIVAIFAAIGTWVTYRELTTKSSKLEYDIRVSFGELDYQEWMLTETVVYLEDGKPYCDERLKITVCNSGGASASDVHVKVNPENFTWGLRDSQIIHSGKTLVERKIIEYDWGPLAPTDAFGFEVVIKIDLESVKAASERGYKPGFKVFVSSAKESFEKFIELRVKTFDNNYNSLVMKGFS